MTYVRSRARASASVVQEIELLKQLRGHAHIVQLERVHTSPCGGRIYLIMEHLPTTLAMLMTENPTAGLPLEQTRGICRQALIALRYLHARDIAHHGLAPSNILFTPGYGSAKLSDFASAGLPGALAAGNARWYRAPEQLVGAPVGCEADVWALGCILFEMAAGAPLLPGNSDAEQLTLVERVVGVLPARFQLGRSATAAAASAGRSSVAVSMHERNGCAADMLCARGVHPDLADVVAACLEVDPLNRASARNLLLMPLFQQSTATQNAPMVPSSTREAGDSVLQQALQLVHEQVTVQQQQQQQQQQQVKVQQVKVQQQQQQQQQVQQEQQEQPAARECNEEHVGKGRLARALSSLRGSFKGLLR
ncbi:hypothetical protein FOA52_002252 [Chlamydomonas sp. UWO 241]|nr:hypothetical protein FOA52_002252 [Chlamydomonas sp. UWO 241]